MFEFAADEGNVIAEFQGDMVFNGVSGDTGTYGLAPMSVEKMARLIQGQPRPEDFPQEEVTEEFNIESVLEMLAQKIETVERQRMLWALAEARLSSDEALTEEQKTYLDAVIEELKQKFAASLSTDEQQSELQTLAADVLMQDEEYEDDDIRKLNAGQMEFLQALVDGAALTQVQQYSLFSDLIHVEEESGTLDMMQGKTAAPFPTKEGVDAAKLEQAGWAIVFPGRMSGKRRKAIKAALKPLLALRKAQAGRLYREFESGSGYRPNERLEQFFKHQNPEIRSGPADPEQMPFYVLLIGSPEEIPYKFQYQLDVMRGVGRLDFGDDYAAYAQYAHNVVLAETGQVKLPRKMTFFGVANPGDKATQLSSKYLIRPLLSNLQEAAPSNDIKLADTWEFETYVAEQAKQAQLKKLMGGEAKATPAILLTASHGMEFSQKNPARQKKYQGALLCQDWGGPGAKVKRNCYFAGEDIDSNANLLGMMAFVFACFGGGTPKFDQFAMQAFKNRAPIAPEGFVADLPQQMLRKGALAVIGHVERAWGYSFVTPSGNPDHQAFVTALRKLLNGDPIGLATDPSFDLRYADISSNLSTTMEELHWDPKYVSAHELAHMWTANNDARSYVIIGDPAVRIPFARNDEEPVERPPLDTQVDLAAYLQETYNVDPDSVSGGAVLKDGPKAADTDSNFGLFDRNRDKEAGKTENDAGDSPLQSLQNIVSNLAEKIGEALEDISSLEVNTYTSSELESIVYNAADKRFKGEIKMRARTHISFDGDMEVCLPVQEDGRVDRELWGVHSEMVKQAQANRAEFLQTLADLAARLVGK